MASLRGRALAQNLKFCPLQPQKKEEEEEEWKEEATDKMAQWIKVLSTKPANLTSTQWEGKNQLPRIVL